ncbi:MAG: hypothetical protein EA402_05820 [Planctomycetota bacterium]|nr:MAG: hypothetical protein EA402_05820 [Planctomycetota bacterium]
MPPRSKPRRGGCPCPNLTPSNSASMAAHLCPLCNKRLATVTLTEVSPDGEVRHLRSCQHCLDRLGAQLGPIPTPIAEIERRNQQDDHPANAPGTQVFHTPEHSAADGDRRCPECGLTWSAFLKRNRFGCPHDVDVFADLLGEPLIELHGADQHRGRSPDQQQADSPSRKQLLQAQLATAVEAENYHRAAELRDALREIEGEGP